MEWYKHGGPVFLYLAGNEALTDSFWTTSDKIVLTQMAENFGAAIYALEHRFYGSSIPFQNELVNFFAFNFLEFYQKNIKLKQCRPLVEAHLVPSRPRPQPLHFY